MVNLTFLLSILRFNVNLFYLTRHWTSFSESKTTSDFFKAELSYDAVADTTNFVKDIFNEEEGTILQMPENESVPIDTIEQDIENSEIDTSTKKHLDQLDKPIVGDVS